VGIVLPNWIGDVVMATPALRALRRTFGPEAEIVGIMPPYVSEVLSGSPWLDEIVYCDRRSRDRGQRTLSVALGLRRRRLDKLLVLTNSLRGGALAWLSGAKQRIGYARRGRGFLLTHRLPPPRDGHRLAPVSAVDYYLELAYAAGCGEEPRRVELFTTADDERAADAVWRKFDLAGRDVFALNTGGAYGAAKHWPIEHCAELARRLVELGNAAVLVICGPAECEAARHIAALAGSPRVHTLADERLGIGLSKACIRRSRLLVSTDSGPRHFAAGFNVPAVALFGPTDPRWSINDHPHEIRLQHPLECQPCGKRVCPLGHHRCMRDLSVDRAFDAVLSLVENRNLRIVA
jgi:heptosyltransferase-2